MNHTEELDIIREIYRTGFPVCEQRDFEIYDSISAENPEFKQDIIYYNGLPAGILFHWDTESFSYLEHFAIKCELRNHGIGGDTLDRYIRKHVRVVLEVDPPNDDICKRRIQFYERHGLYFTNIRFTHPGYPENRSPYELYLMTSPKWSREECEAFLDYLFKHILKAER